MAFLENINIDFLAKRKTAYLISGIIILLGIISLLVRGLEFGIDFKGGSEIALQFEKPIKISEIRNILTSEGLGKIEVKTFGGETGVLIRTDLQTIPKDVFPTVLERIEKSIIKFVAKDDFKLIDTSVASVTYQFSTPELAEKAIEGLFTIGLQSGKLSQESDNMGMIVRIGIADWIEEILREKYADNKFEIQKEDNVGPKIGNELKQNALIAIVLSLFVILIYLAFRFKFIFAFGAVVALFHDVLIVLGLFSLLYGLIPNLNLEISVSVVAAFLTLVGYSINDTVIVFDRIRENIMVHKTAPIKDNINNGINKTLNRTLITSVTTLFVVFILFVFGGEVLRGFAFTLLFGILVGTYSSIFVASPIVFEYATKTKKHIEF